VKDQSHKDEMSAAIRGDFQRLRDRGVAATLAPRDETDASSSIAVDAPIEQHEPPEPEHPPETVPADAVEASAEETAGTPAAEAADGLAEERPGLFARLLGR